MSEYRHIALLLAAGTDMIDDDHSKNVFDPAIRSKTDRFMMRFRKSAA